jgi:uncharacterized protein (DUF4415 family)
MKGKSNVPSKSSSFKPERMSRVPRERRHRASPQETELRNCKVRVTMYLDADIVEHFKERASAPNAAPYQTQINNVLRESLSGPKRPNDYSRLINDDSFIEAIARRVQIRRTT